MFLCLLSVPIFVSLNNTVWVNFQLTNHKNIQVLKQVYKDCRLNLSELIFHPLK